MICRYRPNDNQSHEDGCRAKFRNVMCMKFTSDSGQYTQHCIVNLHGNLLLESGLIIVQTGSG